MLAAAAVCPHPPLLVPALAAGAAPELDKLRAACRQAVDAVVATAPDAVYVVGADSALHARSMHPWGVEVPVDVPEDLPLALLVGAWLTTGQVRSFVVVDDDLEPEDCLALGRELADSAARVGLLIMGDGSARHSEKAPGYLDSRAAAFDESVAQALAAADVEALTRLDPALARELLVAGRAPWQVLAGAAIGRQRPLVRHAGSSAPYGVIYHVVTWTWQESA